MTQITKGQPHENKKNDHANAIVNNDDSRSVENVLDDQEVGELSKENLDDKDNNGSTQEEKIASGENNSFISNEGDIDRILKEFYKYTVKVRNREMAKKIAIFISLVPELRQKKDPERTYLIEIFQQAHQHLFLASESNSNQNIPPEKSSFFKGIVGRSSVDASYIGLQLLDDFRRKLRPYDSGVANALRSISPNVKVLIGTFLAVGFGLFIVFVTYLLGLLQSAASLAMPISEVFGSVTMFATVTSAGAVGGLVSLWTRIGGFKENKDDDPYALVFTGFLKPYIGVAFAVFAYAIVKSNLFPFITVPIDDNADQTKQHAFFLAISFLAGLSERFVNDLVNKAQGQESRQSDGNQTDAIK